MRALIGISTYREEAAWGVWRQRADLLPANYTEAVRAAGANPVLLPPIEPYGDSAHEVIARLDGVVIAGGADISPEAYGAMAHPRTGSARNDRDNWELALLDAAVAQNLPTLGVCRGMQLMAVHAGGALEQHLPDVVGHDNHDPGEDRFGDMPVRLAPNSVMSKLLGAETSKVHCHHHQAVRTHPGFTAVAWAADGTVEAVQRDGDDPSRFFIGVQWHPEVADDRGLFQGLVAAATGFRNGPNLS